VAELHILNQQKMHFVGLKYGMLENPGMNNIKLLVAEA